MSADRLALFAWQQEAKFIPFPMANRVGKIRHVASKLLDQRTERQVQHYRQQVTDGLMSSLRRIGLPDADVGALVDEFWEAVYREMVRARCAQR